jgi:hypothetical protein
MHHHSYLPYFGEGERFILLVYYLGMFARAPWVRPPVGGSASLVNPAGRRASAHGPTDAAAAGRECHPYRALSNPVNPSMLSNPVNPSMHASCNGSECVVVIILMVGMS